MLALIAERVGGAPFAELVRQRVCEPAATNDTEFLRSDQLPGSAAFGYLASSGFRTNVFHLPVRGSGDGGIYSTVADVHLLWDAFFARRIVSAPWVDQMTSPRSEDAGPAMTYGLGFWLAADGSTVMREGCDPGVSFRTVRHRAGAYTHTVISNMSHGAWPLTRLLDEVVAI